MKMQKIFLAAMAAAVLAAAFCNASAAETKYVFRQPVKGLQAEKTCQITNGYIPPYPPETTARWVFWSSPYSDGATPAQVSGCKVLTFTLVSDQGYPQPAGGEVKGEFSLADVPDGTTISVSMGSDGSATLWIGALPIAVAAPSGLAEQSFVENGATATSITPYDDGAVGDNGYVAVITAE